MRQPDLETRLQEGIRLAQAGRRAEARDLLESVVAEDPSQEMAYVWLAAVSRDRGERLQFLRRALAINPGNITAQRAFQKLTGQPYAAATGRAALPPERGSFSGNTLFIVALVLIVAAAVVLASYIGGGGDDQEAAPTPTATLVPGAVAPTEAPSATPRPRNTAAPTRTPGPSPTSVWAAPPVTWTPAPTGTPEATRTPAPTWTPRPTITPSPTVTPVAG